MLVDVTGESGVKGEEMEFPGILIQVDEDGTIAINLGIT